MLTTAYPRITVDPRPTDDGSSSSSDENSVQYLEDISTSHLEKDFGIGATVSIPRAATELITRISRTIAQLNDTGGMNHFHDSAHIHAADVPAHTARAFPGENASFSLERWSERETERLEKAMNPTILGRH